MKVKRALLGSSLACTKAGERSNSVSHSHSGLNDKCQQNLHSTIIRISGSQTSMRTSLTFQHTYIRPRQHTSPPCMFFMLKPSFPFFPFLFFFFLQQHFLMMQKQHVRTNSAATTAIAMRAHGGTDGFEKKTCLCYFSCVSL